MKAQEGNAPNAPKWVRGSELSEHVQAQCKLRFVHRFTGDHTPRWARQYRPDGRTYPVHFKDDADWLAHSHFAVTVTGCLDARVNHCHSAPTWPNNPELRPRSSSLAA